MRPLHKFAVGCMVWSALVGAAGLIGFRGLQIIGGSGHTDAFPFELLRFYVAAEVGFAICVFGLLRRSLWARPGLLILLPAIVLVTVMGFRIQGWSSEAIPMAAWFETVWLSPWVLFAGLSFMQKS